MIRERFPTSRNLSKFKMKKFEIYTVRRDVLADSELDPGIMRGALIVLEVLDWNTKNKVFSTKRHLSNWCKSLGTTYAIDDDEINNGIDYLIAGGFMEYQHDGKGRITLTISAAPQPVSA